MEGVTIPGWVLVPGEGPDEDLGTWRRTASALGQSLVPAAGTGRPEERPRDDGKEAGRERERERGFFEKGKGARALNGRSKVKSPR